MTQATPGARKLAKKLGLDIEQIEGTGNSGYVTEADVEKFVPETEILDAIEIAPEVDRKLMDVAEAIEVLQGTVLPVSVLFDLRFRQDNGQGEWKGDDLLALRPTPVGGAFRSDAGIISWFVVERGHFANGHKPEPVAEPAHEDPRTWETQDIRPPKRWGWK